jgi:hypothetical protein
METKLDPYITMFDQRWKSEAARDLYRQKLVDTLQEMMLMGRHPKVSKELYDRLDDVTAWLMSQDIVEELQLTKGSK